MVDQIPEGANPTSEGDIEGTAPAKEKESPKKRFSQLRENFFSRAKAIRGMLPLREPHTIKDTPKKVDLQLEERELDVWDVELAEIARTADQALNENDAVLLPSAEITDERIEDAESERSVVEKFESQRYVTETPRFIDQVEDTSRTNRFKYAKKGERLDNFDPTPEDEIVEITEHDGLVALKDFLDEVSASPLEYHDGVSLSEEAVAIREDLNFIGENEYSEAVQGLKQLWTSYLEQNPDMQLCILAGVSQHQEKRKSDQYLSERVLASFDDSVLAKYRGRIVTKLDEVSGDPNNVRILLVDDWTMSGIQLVHAAGQIIEDSELAKYKDSLEINLIAASTNRLTNGLSYIGKGGESAIPVKSYYKTHEISHPSEYAIKGESPITGTHSSGDYGFEQIIDRMVKAKRANGEDIMMPPLTNVVREYRYSDALITINPDGSVIRKNQELQQDTDALRREQIEASPLLAQVPQERRQEVIEQTVELYKAAKEHVAPVIVGFADSLLREADGRQIICAGRDGLGTYLAATKLKEKFNYSNDDPDQLIYAYLTRAIVWVTPKDKLNDYLTQLGLHNFEDSVLLADIGMFGSILSHTRDILPNVEMRYLISKASDIIPGYADGREHSMTSVETVVGNSAVHFLEDTFSGSIPSPNNLIEVDGKLQPNTMNEEYPPDEALKREYALLAIEDYVEGMSQPPDQTTRHAIDKLDSFLSDADNYANIMVPHN